MKKKLLFSLFGLLAVAFFAYATVDPATATYGDFATWYSSKTAPNYKGDVNDEEDALNWQTAWTNRSGSTKPWDKSWVTNAIKEIKSLSTDPTDDERAAYITEITTGVSGVISKINAAKQLAADAQASWTTISKVLSYTTADMTGTKYREIKAAIAEYTKLNKAENADLKAAVLGLASPKTALDISNAIVGLSDYTTQARLVVNDMVIAINNLVNDYSDLDNLETQLADWKASASDFDALNGKITTLENQIKAAKAERTYDSNAAAMKQAFDEIEEIAGTNPATIEFPTTYEGLDYTTTTYGKLMVFYSHYTEFNKTTKGKATIATLFATVKPDVFAEYLSVAEKMLKAKTYLKSTNDNNNATYTNVKKFAEETDVDVLEAELEGVTNATTAKKNLYALHRIAVELNGSHNDCANYITKVLTLDNLDTYTTAAKKAYVALKWQDGVNALFTDFQNKYKTYAKLNSSNKAYRVESADITTQAAWNLLVGYKEDIAGYFVTDEDSYNDDNELVSATTKVGTTGYSFTYPSVQMISRNDPYKLDLAPTQMEIWLAGEAVQNKIEGAEYATAIQQALRKAGIYETARKIKASFDAVVGTGITDDITFENYAERHTTLETLAGYRVSTCLGGELAYLAETDDWAPEGVVNNWQWNNENDFLKATGSVQVYGQAIAEEAGKLIDAAYLNELWNRMLAAQWMADNGYNTLVNGKKSLYMEICELTENDGTVPSTKIEAIKAALNAEGLYGSSLVAYVEGTEDGDLEDVKTVIKKLKEVLVDAESDEIVASKVAYFAYGYGQNDVVTVFDKTKAQYNTEECKANIPTSWQEACKYLKSRTIVNSYGDEETYSPVNAYIYIKYEGITGEDADVALANAIAHDNVACNMGGADWKANHIDLNYTAPYYFLNAVKANEVAISRTNAAGSANVVCLYLPFDVEDAASLKGLTTYYVSGAKVDGETISFGLTEKTGADKKLYAFKPYLVKATTAGETVNKITVKAEEGETINIGSWFEAMVAQPVEFSFAGGKIIYNFLSSTQPILAKDYTTKVKGVDVDFTRYFWAGGKMYHFQSTRPNATSYRDPSTLIIDKATDLGVNYVIAGFYEDGDEEATAIESVETTVDETNAIYNVNGVKVQNMAKPGLYIVNGKKMLVK